ncbi:hypothetical protein ACT3UM_17300 [Halomonas sp. AOP13-D3-9]
MDHEKVRAILALSVVIGVLAVAALLVLMPLAAGVQNATDYLKALKEFGAIFSGIIGTIIGFYFGKSKS